MFTVFGVTIVVLLIIISIRRQHFYDFQHMTSAFMFLYPIQHRGQTAVVF